jgi:hypothetical protein
MQTLLSFQELLYGSFLAGSLPGQSKYSLHRDFFRIFGTWVGFRDYAWVG